MRIATFNLENLDLPPKASVALEVRAEVLRPALQRLEADIVCLQEVNAQHSPGVHGRQALALDRLLASTKYADYARVTSTAGDGRGLADVHNLVTLSRFPIRSHRVVRHSFMPPISYPMLTAIPSQPTPQAIAFDRPILLTGSGHPLAIPSWSSMCICAPRLLLPSPARSSQPSSGRR